jgi:hypothetical protein
MIYKYNIDGDDTDPVEKERFDLLKLTYQR